MSIPDVVARLDILIRNTTSNVLAFVVFQQVAERVAIIDALRGKLSVTVLEFMLSPEKCDPFEFLAGVPPEPRQCVVFTEIENALSARTDDNKPKLAGFINLQRERLLEIPHAVIFLVRQYGFREIATHAPDFFHWSSGTFEIASAKQTLVVARHWGQALENPNLFIRDREDAEQRVTLYRELLKEYENNTSRDELFIASLYLNLGDALKWLGKYSEALALFKQAVEIRMRLLGTEDPSTASALNNLAALHATQDQYAEAEPLFKKALEVFEHTLGAENPNTVASLNNLAGLYQSLGRLAEAEPLLKRALNIYEREVGEFHPDTAQTLNNLAVLYASQGRYAEAEPFLAKVLEIRERMLGAEHPDTAQTLNNLALLFASQGRFAEAEPLFKRALMIREHTMGLEHPDTASSLNNLAVLYASQAQSPEAEVLFEKALRIRERVLGFNHPDTIQSRRNLVLHRQSQEDKPTPQKVAT